MKVTITTLTHREYDLLVPRHLTREQIWDEVANTHPSIVYSGGSVLTAIDGREIVGFRKIPRIAVRRMTLGVVALVLWIAVCSLFILAGA